MKFLRDDGGRAAAGYKGETSDCVARSIAIARGASYKDVYRELAMGNGAQRRTKAQVRKGKPNVATAAQGINVKRKWFRDYMTGLGFVWVPTMAIGSGCKVHLRDGELPAGRLVVAVSGHYTAVIDGVIHDTHDPQRDGDRCVYGYWQLKPGFHQRPAVEIKGKTLPPDHPICQMLNKLIG